MYIYIKYKLYVSYVENEIFYLIWYVFSQAHEYGLKS